MAKRDSLALRVEFKRIFIASFVVIGLTGAAAAFAVGFTGSLSQSLRDPASAPLQRLAALERLDQTLGYGGFLKTYGSFLATANREVQGELRRFSDEADAGIDTYARAAGSESDRGEAVSLRSLTAPFRRAALFGSGAAAGANAGGIASLTELERAYANLKAEIAKASDAANFDRIRSLSEAFIWAQATSVSALSLLAIMLFALAWYLRERLLAPMDALRQSINATAAGAIAEPVWGIERKDEIGALARSAERLRQHAAAGAGNPFAQVTDHLAKSALRLEHDLAHIASAATAAQMRIEDASARAAKASQAAVEVAHLARDGAARLAVKAEGTIDSAGNRAGEIASALISAVKTLSEAAARLEQQPPRDEHLRVSVSRLRRDDAEPAADGAAVLEDLLADLNALERFAEERKTIATDHAVVFTAALIDAIDRLNIVAERVASAADDGEIRGAA